MSRLEVRILFSLLMNTNSFRALLSSSSSDLVSLALGVILLPLDIARTYVDAFLFVPQAKPLGQKWQLNVVLVTFLIATYLVWIAGSIEPTICFYAQKWHYARSTSRIPTGGGN